MGQTQNPVVHHGWLICDKDSSFTWTKWNPNFTVLVILMIWSGLCNKYKHNSTVSNHEKSRGYHQWNCSKSRQKLLKDILSEQIFSIKAKRNFRSLTTPNIRLEPPILNDYKYFWKHDFLNSQRVNLLKINAALF